jgi:hypothetical protein
MDCDYDFLKKVPKQKLDEVASFARAFFHHEWHYCGGGGGDSDSNLPNPPPERKGDQ